MAAGSARVATVVPAVVAVNNSVTASSLSEGQILDIYGGRVTNWKQVGGADATIVALTRNEADMNKRAWRTTSSSTAPPLRPSAGFRARRARTQSAAPDAPPGGRGHTACRRSGPLTCPDGRSPP